MTTYERAKLLNERVLRATSYIEKLRKYNSDLKEEIISLKDQFAEPVSVVDSEDYLKLQEQVKKLNSILDTLKDERSTLEKEKAIVEKELDQTLGDLNLVSNHNAELEEYVDNMKEDTKKIEASMSESLAALDEIVFDDVEIASINELDTAESFSTGDVNTDEASLDDDINFGL